MRILSWNVNGIRSVAKKGFIEFLESDNPDVLCIQETKAREEDIPNEIKTINRYHSYFSSPERKGYSGVGIYTKEKPLVKELNKCSRKRKIWKEVKKMTDKLDKSIGTKESVKLESGSFTVKSVSTILSHPAIEI